jgi:hypothetical protein
MEFCENQNWANIWSTIDMYTWESYWNPISNMLEPHWPQYDSPILCVNAQQYSSTTSTHSAFTPHRDKIHIFKKCPISTLLLFILHLKSSHLKQCKVGSAVLDYKVPHLCVNTFILLHWTAQSLCDHINILCYNIHTTSVSRYSLCGIIQTYYLCYHIHTMSVYRHSLCGNIQTYYPCYHIHTTSVYRVFV